jgi:hypothetical protein
MAEDAWSVRAVCPNGSELQFNNVLGNTTVSGFLSQIASHPQFAVSAPNIAVEADGRRLAGSDRIPESVTIVVVPNAKLNRGFRALFVTAHALLITVALRIGMGIRIIVYAVAMLGFGIYTLVAAGRRLLLTSPGVRDARFGSVSPFRDLFLAHVSHRAGHPSRRNWHPIFISLF